MLERELPSGLEEYIDKILSFDRYQGNNSRTAVLASKISELRREYGFPGDMDSDWKEAVNVLRNEIKEKVLQDQTTSLRRLDTSAIIPTYNMIVVMPDISHDN